MGAMQPQHSVGEAEMCVLGRAAVRQEGTSSFTAPGEEDMGRSSRQQHVDVGRQEPGNRNAAAPCSGAFLKDTEGVVFTSPEQDCLLIHVFSVTCTVKP